MYKRIRAKCQKLKSRRPMMAEKRAAQDRLGYVVSKSNNMICRVELFLPQQFLDADEAIV